MEYRIKVVTSSKKESVTLLPDGRYEVRVNAPRKERRANERTCELLAMYFSVSPDAVSVIKGHAQPGKLIRVSDGNQKF
jgi:uncharacterized protein YggU (UPF0235/DUF167 family)